MNDKVLIQIFWRINVESMRPLFILFPKLGQVFNKKKAK